MEISRYHHVSQGRVEQVLALIQRADPIGVGARSPQQAMLIQLQTLAETRPVPAMAERALREGMRLIGRRQYAELASRLGITVEEAEEIIRFISENLNPFPGRAHWGDIRQGEVAAPAVYRHPDIIISQLQSQVEAPLIVEILVPLRGTLRINPLFKQALLKGDCPQADQWHKDLEQANLLIKCLQQRNHALHRLMEALAQHQREFILRGDKFLVPLTRASIAEELGVHESTISRAVSSKTLQLPSGRIIPLEKFFDRSLHIRAAMRQLVASEKAALTDSQLAALLKKQGHPIARRTVAKYRAMEGILPAHLRRGQTHQIKA
jgi:RNA polymerase sigma-54 factor